MNALTSPVTRGRFTATVAQNVPVCDEHLLLILRIDPADQFPPTAPGQFIQLGCSSGDYLDNQPDPIEWTANQVPQFKQSELSSPQAFLRRPFSLAGRRDTDLGTELDIVYRIVGKGTDYLATLPVGATTDLIGPLGNRFTYPDDKSVGLLVGGGVGLPPMFYLAQALAQHDWTGCAFVGAMSHNLLAVNWTGLPPLCDGTPVQCIEQFAKHDFPSVITTNDDSCGHAGLITGGLQLYLDNMTTQQRQQAVVFTCGPNGMMQAVAKLAAEYDIDCQVCTEQAMACGMGTCQSCIVRIRDEDNPHGTLPDGTGWRYRLTCTDGPVFNANDVLW